MTETTLLVTVDSLRYDHYKYMERTREFLGDSHPAAFATITATPGSFQSIIGGIYPGEVGIDADTTVVPSIDHEYKLGISTNRFLSERYGYTIGFDDFTEPSREEEGIKDKVARHMNPKSTLYGVASRAWNVVQSVQGTVGEVGREYRAADDVVEEFLTKTGGRDDWFGWLHFMEPHHPYNPDDAPVSRSEAQQISRRLLDGRGSDRDDRIGRKLYRGEVEELDRELAQLWETIPEDTRVVFCADHGELIGGDDGEWGHHKHLLPGILRVPFATRNVPVESNVVSLVDVPSYLVGEDFGQGRLDREVAFAAQSGRQAAMNREHIATEDGVRTLEGDPADDPQLARARQEFTGSGERPVSKEDLPHDDLEALGYL